MKTFLAILGIGVLVIAFVWLYVWVIQLLGNFLIDYFELPIKHLNWWVALAIAVLFSLLFPKFGSKD